MNDNELKELFKATNTEEPLYGGWPGLRRFGLAVAAAEREACAMVMGSEPFHSKVAADAIRMRSNK